jgi:hypothetical protein
MDMCIDECDTGDDDDKQLLEFSGLVEATHEAGEKGAVVDLKHLTMKGHYEIPGTTISFGNLGVKARASLGKKTKLESFAADGYMCLGKGCTAAGSSGKSFWDALKEDGTMTNRMWKTDSGDTEQYPCIGARAAIGLGSAKTDDGPVLLEVGGIATSTTTTTTTSLLEAETKKKKTIAPFYYLEVAEADFGTFLAVLDIDASLIPSVLANTGIKNFVFSNNLASGTQTTVNPAGKALSIPEGLNVRGQITNIFGIADAEFALTVNPTSHFEGMFNLECMKIGSIVEVVKTKNDKVDGNTCNGASIKAYIGVGADARSGEKSGLTGVKGLPKGWCKGQFCAQGGAHVSIPFLGIKASFSVNIMTHKGALSAKGLPMGFLPFNMDVDMEWAISTKPNQLSASAKLALVIDTSQIQSAVAVLMYGLVKAVSAVVSALKAALRWVIKWIKLALVALRHTITIVINVVQGAVNVARSFLTQVRKKNASFRAMLVRVGLGW